MLLKEKILTLTSRQTAIIGASIALIVVSATAVQEVLAVKALYAMLICALSVGILLWIIKNPQHILVAIPATLPFVGFSLFNIGTTFGFDSSYLLLSVLMVIVVLRHSVRPTTGHKFILTAVLVLMVGWITSSLAVFLHADFIASYYLKSLMHALFYIVFLLSAIQVETDENTFKKILAVIVATSAVVCTYGVYQVFARIYGLPFAFLDLTSARQGVHIESLFGEYTRVSSFFSEPSWLGHYAVKSVVVNLLMYLGADSLGYGRWKRPLLMITLLFVFITLLLSFSAGAFVTLALVVVIMIGKECAYRRRLLALLVTSLLLFVLVNYFLVLTLHVDLIQLIGERFLGLITGNYVSGESIGQRMDETEAAVTMWRSSPVWGIGLGNAKAGYGELLWISNYYMVVLAEQGIIGIITTASFFLILFIMLFRAFKGVRAGSSAETLGTIIFYLLLTDMISLSFAGDIMSAKYWYDIWLVFAYLLLIQPIRSVAEEIVR